MADFFLWCDHCGCEAIESPDGMFEDGAGGTCMTCNFPGRVSVDDAGCPEDNHAYWNESEEPEARCNQEDCEECHAAK